MDGPPGMYGMPKMMGPGMMGPGMMGPGMMMGGDFPPFQVCVMLMPASLNPKTSPCVCCDVQKLLDLFLRKSLAQERPDLPMSKRQAQCACEDAREKQLKSHRCSCRVWTALE